MKSNFTSGEKFAVQSEDEVLKQLAETDKSLLQYLKNEVALYGNIVFLRPHHLRQWYFAVDCLSGHKKKLDKRKLKSILMEIMLERVKKDISKILSGDLLVNHLGRDLEYLGLIKNPHLRIITTLEKRTLQRTLHTLTQARFSTLANKMVGVYAEILGRSDTSLVVLARVLDYECKLLSQKGCTHCTERINVGFNEDEFLLSAIEFMVQNAIIEKQNIKEIKINYFKGSNVVQSVVIPLKLLKDKNFLESIRHFMKSHTFFWDEKKGALSVVE